MPSSMHDVRVRKSKHVCLDYFGGEPDVKLQETIQSAMILLFTLFQVDILVPHLANDSCSRLLVRKTLTSCSSCSIGTTPLMGHETTKHSGLRALSLDMLANDHKMKYRESHRLTLLAEASPPTLFAGVPTDPDPPVTAVVLPDEAMIEDI
jgi:hypothetical protein